jgi:hypothetical protein
VWRRSAPSAIVVVAALLAADGQARAQPPLTDTARLLGQFQMVGRVTVAKHILGEHRGETVVRTWTFTPLCQTGPCASVRLVRQRAGGTDTLVLRETSPGSYAGHGLFYAPLRCGRRIYRSGETVPFTITLQVTVAATVLGVPIATGVAATYEDKKRLNLTRCVAVPGHDAAAYLGQIASGPPPAQG